jgi:protein TonB
VRTSWLLVSLAVHGAAVTAAIGFGAYAALQPKPPVAHIEIQQQIASISMPSQVIPNLDVTSEELVESVAVQEFEVDEQPVVEKPAEKPVEPIILPDVKPTPTEVMRQLTAGRVLAKAAEPEATPAEISPAEATKPVVEPATPQVASVPQEYVEAQRSDNKPPAYPKKERRLSREGQVTVRITIDVNGSVKGAIVIEATRSRYQGFNTAAREAALKWKFTPAMRGGVPVESETDIEVVFRLTDS